MRAASVGDLLDVLQGVGVRLLSDPAGRQLAVRHPVLADGPLPPTRGGLLLLAGAGVADPATTAAVREAATNGYGAVAVKLRDADPAALAAVADRAGVALLGVEDDLEWLQLAAILGTVLDAAGHEALRGSDAPVGDLFGLANAVAAATGGAVAVEDLGRRVLAYSTVPGQALDEDRRQGILGRQVPELPENEAQYRELYRSTGVVRFDAVPPALPRVATAVRAGAEPLGSLWVVGPGEGDLLPGHEAALLAAAEMAALHLLRARSAADLARQRRADLTRDLLAGDAEPAATLDRLGVPPAGPFALLGFEPSGRAGLSAPTDRLADLVSLHLEARLGPVATCAVGGRVYALVHLRRATDADRLVGLVRDLVATASSTLRLALLAAIGPVLGATGSTTDFAAARQDADRVLDLLHSDSRRSPVASNIDVADQLALAGLGPLLREQPHLASRVAAAVLAHDAEHGTAYAGLLLAWLDVQGDVGACAARLVVHPNTVRYRLGRARDLFGLDPDDPDQLLMLWLALRVRLHDSPPAA